MKKHGLIFITIGLILIAAAVIADEDSWFDTERCIYCRELAAVPGLLTHMDHELYDLKKGAISITTVAPEYLDSYREAVDKMMVVGKEIAEGKHKNAYVCGHCRFFGLMIMQGVDIERIMTKSGEIMVMTSDDSTKIELIHEYAEKSRQAVAEMREGLRDAD